MARDDDEENVTRLDGNDEAPMTDKADDTGCLTLMTAADAAAEEDAASDDWLNKL
jgi:hypothetical protein